MNNEMMIEDYLADRTMINAMATQGTTHNHEYIGDCLFCKKPIYADDVDYFVNDEEQLGVCYVCMRNCRWRCE